MNAKEIIKLKKIAVFIKLQATFFTPKTIYL